MKASIYSRAMEVLREREERLLEVEELLEEGQKAKEAAMRFSRMPGCF